NGMLGSFRSDSLPSLNRYWRALSLYHGGIYGGLGTASFLREFFPNVPRSLIILFVVLSIGVIIVVVKFSHGRIG
nr:hypothetical protein [Tanacetum cinerariifolium]